MNTCKSCHYFEPVKGHPQGVGHCLANPPVGMPVMAPVPGGVLKPTGPQMMPSIQGVECPTMPGRRACRHFQEIFDAAE